MPSPKQCNIEDSVLKQPSSVDKKFRESAATIGPIVPFERDETPYDDALDIMLDSKKDKDN